MTSNQEVIDQLGAELWCPSTDKKSKPGDVLSDKLVSGGFACHIAVTVRLL
jgi:hypothetical protein